MLSVVPMDFSSFHLPERAEKEKTLDGWWLVALNNGRWSLGNKFYYGSLWIISLLFPNRNSYKERERELYFSKAEYWGALFLLPGDWSVHIAAPVFTQHATSLWLCLEDWSRSRQIQKWADIWTVGPPLYHREWWKNTAAINQLLLAETEHIRTGYQTSSNYLPHAEFTRTALMCTNIKTGPQH